VAHEVSGMKMLFMSEIKSDWHARRKHF